MLNSQNSTPLFYSQKHRSLCFPLKNQLFGFPCILDNAFSLVSISWALVTESSSLLLCFTSLQTPEAVPQLLMAKVNSVSNQFSQPICLLGLWLSWSVHERICLTLLDQICKVLVFLHSIKSMGNRRWSSLSVMSRSRNVLN